MKTASAEEMAKTSQDISDQVLLANNLLAESRWTQGGQALSVIKVNDKVIEEKEKELVDCIAQNYSKLKGVERELAGLQLELKLTSGPKKSALELIRKKIEMQNENVLASRSKFQAARKIAEAAEEVLRTEEAKKDKLCQELNLLVQQSAHAQLERLEQLTHRMENLNQGFVAGHSSPEAGASSLYERANPTEHSPNRSPMMEGGSHPATGSSAAAGSAEGTETGAESVEERQLKGNSNKRSNSSPDHHSEPAGADIERQATAARSRHIPLPKAKRQGNAAGKLATAGNAQPPSADRRKPAAASKPFTGF